jgi:hypothetical protein
MTTRRTPLLLLLLVVVLGVLLAGVMQQALGLVAAAGGWLGAAPHPLHLQPPALV